jgi:hypothetical protein
MSDGPFKNLKLGKRWKRFADAVQNDTFNCPDCCSMASHALMHELLTDNVRAILAVLQAYASRKQLDIDPSASVDSIFNAHMSTPFSDILQKQIAFRLNDQVSPADAVRQALEESVSNHSNDVRNRIIDECISAREAGDMRQDLFSISVKNVNSVFDSLAKDRVCEALLDGNKNAFKTAASKKQGIDEGPPL